MEPTAILALALGSQLASGPRLYAFRDCPMVDAPAALVVAGGSWQQHLCLPNLVFAIDHPQGLMLVDAGYGSRFGEYRRTFPANLLYAIAHVAWGPPRQGLPEQLAACGLAPERVRRILITHAHFDHVGGTVDFPQAEVVMSRAEGRFFQASAPSFLKESLASRLRLIDLEAAGPAGIFPHGLDLFGDGTVVLLDTHGHTPGHMGILLRLGSGRRVLLAGDTAWVHDHYAHMKPRGWPTRLIMDRGSNEDALRQLHHLDQVDPSLRVVPSHDPDAERDLPYPPDALD